MLKTTFITITFVILTSASVAQQHQLGFSIGNGNFKIEEKGPHWLHPFNKEETNYFQTGVNYFLIPNKSIFKLKTGVIYSLRINKEM